LSRRKEQSALARESSTNKILETAIQLFAQMGYDKTSIRQIAQEAGISLGLMYNYFPGKEALLRAIIMKGFGQIKESMQPYSEPLPPREAIKKHIDLSYEIATQNREFWLLINGLRLQSEIIKQMHSEIEEVNKFILSTLAENYAKLNYKEPLLEAFLLFATIDGIINQMLMLGDEYPARQIFEQLKNRI
jgi:AcrR family transcriptional regulator